MNHMLDVSDFQPITGDGSGQTFWQSQTSIASGQLKPGTYTATCRCDG